MATAAKQRRRRKNMSKKTMKPASGATTTTVHDLPDHIFERILLCLGPSRCLVRAAAVCRGWCRVIADGGFLARLRSAHPHGGTRLGHYYGNGFFGRWRKSAVFVPFLPAAAMVVQNRCRFNLDLLPGGRRSWKLVDSRGSLLLLTKLRHQRHSMHFDLLVYEPLTGRQQLFLTGPSGPVDAFLADGGGDDSCRIGKTIFRVLVVGVVAHEYEYVASVYSSGRDGSLHRVHTDAVSMEQPWYKATLVGRADGSIYWRIFGRAAVLALHEATVHFSIIQFPVNIWGPYNVEERLIGGEDGALRIVRLMSNELKIFVRRRCHPASDGSDDDSWVLEKHLLLPEEGATTIATANSKYVILTPTVTTPGQPLLFSVELDTMRVEREHERNKHNGEMYPYELPWPPVLPDITSH